MAERAERQLTTILAADVAEYSRLMRANEDGTLALLTACRTILDALIAKHRGRIANTAGDSVLAEFPSVAEGLSRALAIQEAIAEHNEPLSPDRQMRFRIGLHLGDVLIRAGDLFGDAVNIAARLQALAEPGGVCVSAAVREHAGTRLAAIFTDAGSQLVKNIAEPVHVFHAIATGVVQPSNPPPALSLPDKPSVAVLPFTNMSVDPEQEFFADGIGEDVITALSRYPSLFVIPRNSCFTYKGRSVDVKQVGRELGVRYVLEGSLRKSGDRIRVTAQLVEAESGKHVWAERYDHDLADIFALQDEITEAVTIAIVPAIADAEQQRAMRRPPRSLDAWAAYQRGLWHVSRFTSDDNSLAQNFFQRAIDLDPTFSGGYVGLGMAQLHASEPHPRGLLDTLSSVETLARRAVALDGADAEARSLLSNALLARGDYEGALAEAERAQATTPNLAFAHYIFGLTLIFSGRPKRGLVALERSIRLDPRHPRLARDRLMQVALALYLSRKYSAAIEAAKRAIRSYPDYPNTYRWLAAALGQFGRIEEAKEAPEKAIAIGPASFEMYVRTGVPFMRPEDHAHMIEGLRKAGWEG